MPTTTIPLISGPPGPGPLPRLQYSKYNKEDHNANEFKKAISNQ